MFKVSVDTTHENIFMVLVHTYCDIAYIYQGHIHACHDSWHRDCL